MPIPRNPQHALGELLRQKSARRANSAASLPHKSVQERFAARLAEIAREKSVAKPGKPPQT